MKTNRQNPAYDEDMQKLVERCSPPQLNAPVTHDGDEEDDSDHAFTHYKRTTEIRRDCPYLYTVNRKVLNFELEKLCSVSLSKLNVYACLVCGNYFQGRGKTSHAYNHSLKAGHHVYINLHTQKVYCLPDGYEIYDPSLDDIRRLLNPRINKDQVLQLDTNRQGSRDNVLFHRFALV